MNKIDFIINLLLKDNNISVKVKNLGVNFNMFDNSVNKVSQTLNAVSADISGSILNVNTSINKISTTVEKTTNNITTQLNKISFAAFVDNIRNVSDSFKSLSGPGIGFEQSMADLSSITGITGKELTDLGRIARETGKSSGLGAAGAAEAFALLASQIQVDKIGMEGLKTLQKETITLAQAGGMSMTDAATAVAGTINQFGLEATEANRVINVLAAGSKYGSAGITELSQSFKVVGGVVSAAGLSVEQTVGALEVLSKNNLKGSEAGTALQNIMGKLQTTLGQDLGKIGLSNALEGLKPKLNDVTYLAKLFGEENVAAAQFLITNASAVGEMTEAVTGTNVAQEQAAIRTNTTAERMKQIQATIDDYKIGLFDLTGGVSGYISAMGDSAVMVAQMMPIFAGLKTAYTFLTTGCNRVTLALYAKSAAEKAGALVTKALSVAQTALNAVMNANPIALIVMAIAALTAGLIVAYNRSESFRRVVDKIWEGIKRLAAILWDKLVKAFSWLSNVIGSAWSKLKSFLGIEGETSGETERLTEKTEALATSSQTAAEVAGLLTAALDGQNKKLNTNLSTLGGIEQKISDLKAKQKETMEEQAVALEKEITLWEKKQKEMKSSITLAAREKPELSPIENPNQGAEIIGQMVSKPKLNTPEGAVAEARHLQEMVQKLGEAKNKIVSLNESIFGQNSVIAGWADQATSGITRITAICREFSDMMKNDTLTSVQKVSGGITAMGALMGAMGSMVDGAAGSWLTWGGNILAMVAAAIPELLTLFGIQCSLAVSNAASTLLPPFNIIAIAATVASIAAAVANIPKPKAFAAGGIVYGSTFAQVGEYPGAANNPEVIAPLSKLRRLIQPVSDSFGRMEFRIRGTDLYAIYNKVDHANTRTR